MYKSGYHWCSIAVLRSVVYLEYNYEDILPFKTVVFIFVTLIIFILILE